MGHSRLLQWSDPVTSRGRITWSYRTEPQWPCPEVPAELKVTRRHAEPRQRRWRGAVPLQASGAGHEVSHGQAGPTRFATWWHPAVPHHTTV